MKQYKAAQLALQAAREKQDKPGIEAAQNELSALILFKGDMGAYIRLYTFLCQIFNYGNTAIEKRAIFFRRLLPLLEFGREREEIDLSKVVLTHHHLKNLGKQGMTLGEGDKPKLGPITEAGSGGVHEKETAYLTAIIEKVNDLFHGGRTHRSGQAGLREQRDQRQAPGIRDPAPASGEQHQGTVRQFTGPEDRAAERHHGGAGRPHLNEHSGAELQNGADRDEGHPAQPRRIVGIAQKPGVMKKTTILE